MVGGVAVSQQRFPWHVPTDRVRKSWAGWGILRVEMDDAERVRLLEVFHNDNEGGVATVWVQLATPLLQRWRRD